MLELEKQNTEKDLEKLAEEAEPLQTKRMKLTDVVRKENEYLEKYRSLKYRSKDIAQNLAAQDWLPRHFPTIFSKELQSDFWNSLEKEEKSSEIKETAEEVDYSIEEIDERIASCKSGKAQRELRAKIDDLDLDKVEKEDQVRVTDIF